MRLDDYRTSDNVRDEGSGGFGGGGGLGLGGGGGGGLGGGLGLIIGLVASRFGIVGVLVVLGLGWALGMFGGGGSQLVGTGQPGTTAGSGAITDPRQACAQSQEHRFSCQVLASTEDTWARVFQGSGQPYQPAGFSFFTNSVGAGECGNASAAVGPFYCPANQRVYLSISFFEELQTKFGAGGDFAQAYVIAHEVGHHVQTLTGVSNRVRQAQASAGKAEGNRYQVAMELQADCYAGVWAAANRDRLDPGDVQEGLRAAQQIGDDTLQRQAQGYVVPESFTHGTSAQRQQWLNVGLKTGDPAQCDTFGSLGLV